jgi:hypothetical protein
MLIWAAIVFVVAVGVGVIVARQPLARAEAYVAGGTVRPGCVMLQGALLLLLAALIIALHAGGVL